jgi:hypothetical protein
MLDKADTALILERKKSLRHLDKAMWIVPLLWLGTVLWTWFRFPLMNNPWALHERLSHKGSLSRTSLESLAAMTPIVTLLSQFLVLALIWMGLRLLRRERRMVELIEDAYGPVDPDPGKQ